MEAVPKLALISFDLKASPENAHFGPKLKQYIAEAYHEDPETYSNEIHQLEGLRSAAVRPAIDATGISALNRYFCQLRALQSRFPMSKGQPAAVSFTWKDAFANMTCDLPDIRFEMACILYNIGALHSRLGAAETRTTSEGLKTACTHFQTAAWAFLYLREQYPQPAGIDLSSEVMRMLQEVCLAQAQECIMQKSILDTRKPSVVGAVAMQVLLFYRNALNWLGPAQGHDTVYDVIGTNLYNHLNRHISFKVAFIGCIVSLYQGLNAEEQQKMGERVAFYQAAVDRLAEARKLAKHIEPKELTQEALTFTNDVVEGKRKAAKNENEFIYHEEVPDKDLLTDLKPVCLAKPLAINFNDVEISGPDIFGRLVPMVAHEASSLYSEEKAKLLRRVVDLAETKNTELLEFMASLQLELPESLKDAQKIPQEIVDRCAAMNAKTEIIQTLVDSMNYLAEIITDVEHSLAELKELTQEETVKEKEYQKMMGPRPPSIVQTELAREANKYQEAHNRTNESNQVLHKAMTLHLANLRLLASPLDYLIQKIPSISHIDGLDIESMAEMNRVVSKAREMQRQRDVLIQQLRDSINEDDITSQLLARSGEPQTEIFKQELEKHSQQVKLIELNLAAQENIINRLTSVYASYGESRRQLADVLRRREALINALITSYDTHEDLLAKSQKGLEFYRKLSNNVSHLLTRIKSTCQVQEEERAQLLSKQPSQASSSPAKSNEGSVPPSTESSGPKLRDYLPYMKSRAANKNMAPAQPDNIASDSFYPDVYPTSVRPAPLGSEASADGTPVNYTDGYAVPSSQGSDSYNPYNQQYPYSDNSTYVAQPPDYSNYPSVSTANFGYDQQKLAHGYQPSAIPTENTNYGYNTDSSGYGYRAESTGYGSNTENTGYGYNNTFIPGQFSAQSLNPQNNFTPYYTGSQDVNTSLTGSTSSPQYGSDSVPQANINPSTSQYTHPTERYNVSAPANQMGAIPEVPSSVSAYPGSQNEFNANFAQMQVSGSKVFDNNHFISNQVGVNFPADYSQTYFNANAQYPQIASPNIPTYSSATQPAHTNMANSQVPQDYNSLNYPYSVVDASNIASGQGYPSQTPSPAPSVPTTYNNNPTVQYFFDSTGTYVSSLQSGYANYANSVNSGIASYPVSSSASINPANVDGIQSAYSNYGSIVTESDVRMTNAPVSEINSIDQPIRSHVTGQAFGPDVGSMQQIYQNYNDPQVVTPVVNSYCNPNEPSMQMQNNPVYNYADQTASGNYESYQNHPGYSYNPLSGAYDYTYGSQNTGNSQTSENVNQPKVNSQPVNNNQTWDGRNVYTSAGTYDTVQSPSEIQSTQVPQGSDPVPSNDSCSPLPYGYKTNANETSGNPSSKEQTASTNYGEEVNDSTNMQSGQSQESTLSHSQSQEPPSVPTPDIVQESTPPIPKTGPSDTEPSVQSTMDLLSGLDFSLEQAPLKPQIKVPPVSELVIKKPIITPKLESAATIKPVIEEVVMERPAKRDIFSDPSLLNRFTQEVKKLQTEVDSLTSKTPNGLTLLDTKWKVLQDIQAKENMSRSKNAALECVGSSSAQQVVPFDDSRLKLKTNPEVFINATYYKQLASWCVPLIVSTLPEQRQHSVFWTAVLENKVACVICLLSEMELQGKSYWPTAKGQVLELDGSLRVTLEEVTCTVHWTERRLSVSAKNTALTVLHYQINVFPAKVVCSPLVLLADRVLGVAYDNKLSNQLGAAWVHCQAGGGRSSLLALLMMAMCQLRAGQVNLCDMLDTACINLYKHRTNVLEDTKFLADVYITTLFYVQGVLCSGSTMFNGEMISAQSGASVQLPPIAAPQAREKAPKVSKESFEEMKQSPGLTSGDMKDPLNFLDPLWSLKKK